LTKFDAAREAAKLHRSSGSLNRRLNVEPRHIVYRSDSRMTVDSRVWRSVSGGIQPTGQE
jgi:hypothetical protein